MTLKYPLIILALYVALTIPVHLILTEQLWPLQWNTLGGDCLLSMMTVYAMYLYIVNTNKQQQSIWFKLVVCTLSVCPVTCHVWVVISLMIESRRYGQNEKMEKMRYYEHALAVSIGSLTAFVYLLVGRQVSNEELFILLWLMIGAAIMITLVAGNLPSCSKPTDHSHQLLCLTYLLFYSINLLLPIVELFRNHHYIHKSLICSKLSALGVLLSLKFAVLYRSYFLSQKLIDKKLTQDFNHFEQYYTKIQNVKSLIHQIHNNLPDVIPEIQERVKTVSSDTMKQHINIKMMDTFRMLNRRIQAINQQIGILETSKNIISTQFQLCAPVLEEDSASRKKSANNQIKGYINTIQKLKMEIEHCKKLKEEGSQFVDQSQEDQANGGLKEDQPHTNEQK